MNRVNPKKIQIFFELSLWAPLGLGPLGAISFFKLSKTTAGDG
jgi:hypothetical protein